MLDNAWLVPLIPAVSFFVILLFGKRLPRKGSEVGILALTASFVLAVGGALQWIGKEAPREAVERHHTWFMIGWELVGLCSFMLIGHWWEEGVNSGAAIKAFITTRTGDIGLMLGIITLFFAAGRSFDIANLN